jgi:cobalamin biosynthesis Mg chelatase CobN
MRMRRFVAPLALMVAALPTTARAGTTMGDLVLTPHEGVAGSHFTATFTFTEAACTAFTVAFYWDPPSPAAELGQADAVSVGTTCQASIQAVVPSSDAVAGHSYQVGAYAGTKQVNAGNSAAVISSSKDSGVAPFEVTSAAGQGTQGGGASPSAATHSTATSSTTSTRSSSGTASSSGTSSSTSAAGTDASGSGTDDSSTSTDRSRVVPLNLGRVDTPGSGVGVAVAVAAVLVALVAAVWAQRSGKLRAFRRK